MCFGECYDEYNQIYRIVELIEDRNREIHNLYKKLYLQEYEDDDEKYDIIIEIKDKKSVIKMYMSSIAYNLICIREGKGDKLCCWQCKYYDVKKLYCKDLDKKVSPFSLCPEIIDIEAEELRERKGFLHDNVKMEIKI